jgi:hypothetical protein
VLEPTLSIICSSFRNQFLDVRLQEQVRKQPYQGQVELLILNDNDWASIGRKHQRLVEMARGEFIMRVDDDDIVSPRMLPMVLDRLKPGTVSVGLNVLMLSADSPETLCRLTPWYFMGRPDKLEAFWSDGDQHRVWHHICPTRRELFEGVEWDNSSWGEDDFLARQIIPKISALGATETPYLNESLYFAFPRAKTSSAPLKWKLRYGGKS